MRPPALLSVLLLLSASTLHASAAPTAPSPRGAAAAARGARGRGPARPEPPQGAGRHPSRVESSAGSSRGAGGASGSGRGAGRGKAGGRPRPDARTPEGRAALNVWQRVTHEACLHLAAGEDCAAFMSEHHDEFVERQQGFAARLSKAPLFEAPRDLCDTIVERFLLTDKKGLEGKDFCDENFPDLVAHASAMHWKHLNPHEDV